MDNKKGIIIVIVILDIIILLLLGYFILSRRYKYVEDIPTLENKNIIEDEVPYVNDVNTSKNDNIIIEHDNKVDNDEVKENKASENIVNEDNNSNNTGNGSSNDNTDNTTTTTNTNIPPSPVITYTCPDGYTLNDKKCLSIIDANYVCPENTTDYADANIPRDKYCVNLSEGYQSDTDSCPDNYGVIAIIGFGSPTVYRCLPLHEKYYTCPEGYNLEGIKCTKEIDAIKK